MFNIGSNAKIKGIIESNIFLKNKVRIDLSLCIKKIETGF
jgi:hypothetical protein